jgi:hypothetical protein
LALLFFKDNPMGDITTSRNIGALVSIATSVEPQSSAAATIDGASIDRAAHGMPLSCLMHQQLGAVSGAPSATSVQTSLQHAPDNATWSNYTDPDTDAVAQTAALTAANSENGLAVDLSNANRWIRAVTVVGFTGGTSPTALVAAELVLGGEPLLPAS